MAMASASHPCMECGKPASTQVCGGCKLAHYCSRNCQDKAWRDHRWDCSLPKRDPCGLKLCGTVGCAAGIDFYVKKQGYGGFWVCGAGHTNGVLVNREDVPICSADGCHADGIFHYTDYVFGCESDHETCYWPSRIHAQADVDIHHYAATPPPVLEEPERFRVALMPLQASVNADNNNNNNATPVERDAALARALFDAQTPSSRTTAHWCPVAGCTGKPRRRGSNADGDVVYLCDDHHAPGNTLSSEGEVGDSAGEEVAGGDAGEPRAPVVVSAGIRFLRSTCKKCSKELVMGERCCGQFWWD